MRTVHVSLRKRIDDSYDILIGNGMFEAFADDLARQRYGRRYVFLCDSNTVEPYGRMLADAVEARGVESFGMSVPAGEESKDLSVFGTVLEGMREAGVDRGDCLVAVGGGVVGDLGGYVAGCYMRGIPFVQVPTTLLSQVDSSVGGKVAVNIAGGKNYCGLFYQPKRVYIDTQTLGTLPESEYLSGLAEVLKYGLIRDAGFCGWLMDNADAVLARDREALAHLVSVSCAAKAAVVEEDEHEGGTRMILNYGHTVGHAIEQISEYSLAHGVCVAYGMRTVARTARDLGMLSSDSYERHEALLDRYGLAREPLGIDPETTVALTVGDKKARGGKVVFVVPTALGHVEIRDDIPLEAVQNALAGVIVG